MSEDIPMKKCTGPCGQEYEATTEYWHKGGKDGFKSRCKECRLKKEKEYRDRPDSREQRLAKQRANYQIPEVKERILSQGKQYRNKPGIKERKSIQDKAYKERPEIREKIKENHKKYYSRPEIRDRRNAYVRDYIKRPHVHERRSNYNKLYEKRPERIAYKKAHNKNYYSRPEVQKRVKNYRNRPEIREHYRTLNNNNRALRRSVKGTHSPQQIQEQLKRQKHKCYYCHNRLKKTKGQYIYDIDHTFPVSRVVGMDIPANGIDYLVLACPTCNRSKHDKFPWEWAQGGRLL